MKKEKKSHFNLWIYLMITVCILSSSIAYSALNANLKITGDVAIQKSNNIEITNVKLLESLNDAEEDDKPIIHPNYTDLDFCLYNPDSVITYAITITNNTSSNKTISSMFIDRTEGVTGGPADFLDHVEFDTENLALGKIIPPSTSKTINVKFYWYNNTIAYPWVEIKVAFEYNNYSSSTSNVMQKAESNPSANSYFLNGPIKRDEIRDLFFSADGCIESGDAVHAVRGIWDVSVNKNGSILAIGEMFTNGLNVTFYSNNGKANADSSYLFSYLDAEISVAQLDTTNVTNMSSMFRESTSRNSDLDLMKWTFENVTNTNSMFYNFKSIYKNFRLEMDGAKSFDKVTNYTNMFYNFSSSNISDIYVTYNAAGNWLIQRVEEAGIIDGSYYVTWH